MLYRVSNAVIAPNLVRDLHLDAEALGLLGGAFFYSFALFQIPMGPMLDRMGPRMVITFSSLIGSLGAFLFACGESLTGVFVGRIVIGIGMASILMGSLKVFVLRFPSEKFATLAGVLVSIGTFGNIFATSPLAYLTSTIGWRTTFILAGIITAILAILAFFILGEKNEKDGVLVLPSTAEPQVGILRSIRPILGSLAFWQIGTISFFRYGIFVSLQGLWLGPYLMDTRGYSPIQTGNLLIFLAIGTIVGSPIAGRLSDRTFRSRKGVALCGLSFYVLCLIPLIGILKIQSPYWYGFIFFLMGFFHAFGMVTYSHAKDLFPTSISGTVMTWINFFSMAGAAVFMTAIGRIIQSFPPINYAYSERAYHLAFLICFVAVTASIVFYGFSKKEK